MVQEWLGGSVWESGLTMASGWWPGGRIETKRQSEPMEVMRRPNLAGIDVSKTPGASDLPLSANARGRGCARMDKGDLNTWPMPSPCLALPRASEWALVHTCSRCFRDVYDRRRGAVGGTVTQLELLRSFLGG